MRVAAARRIIVSQSVDEADLRVPLQNRLHVNDRDTFDAERGNDLERTQKRLELSGNFRLQRPDHHILSAVMTAPSLVEHPKGFADAGCIAKKNLKAAPCGVWSVFCVQHCRLIVTLARPLRH